jgi:hypothetical protein
LNYYNSIDKDLVDDEKVTALKYLKEKGFSIFPHPFQEKYKPSDIKVHTNPINNLKYIITNEKQLYFKRKSSKRGVRRNYNFLKIEQDSKSPHRYLTKEFDVEENEILVDVGPAEGNLSLGVIEKIKKAYLFETDERWIEALEATFAPWKEKVTIVNKFVSNINDEKNVSLDEYFKDKEPFTFLKVDAEGTEDAILEGAEKSISESRNLKLALCCYHKPYDEDKFKAYLENKIFSISFADGYMIFPDPKTFKPPYLRRGVLRAKKSS